MLYSIAMTKKFVLFQRSLIRLQILIISFTVDNRELSKHIKVTQAMI